MANEIFRLEIDVVGDAVPQLKKINSQLNKQDKTLKAVNKTLKTTATLFLAAFGAAAVRALGVVVDDVILVESQLANLTDTQEEIEAGFDQIAAAAGRTRTSITNFGKQVTQLGVNTRQFGFDTQELVTINEALANSFRLSGTNAETAAQASLQLNQALASGRLAGDEFRSVSEANAVLLEALSKELNTNRGELRKLASEGKITGEVLVNALVNNFEEFNKGVKNLNPTLAQTAALLKNELTVAVEGFLDVFDFKSVLIEAGQAFEGFGLAAKKSFIEIRALANSLINPFQKIGALFEAIFSGEKEGLGEQFKAIDAATDATTKELLILNKELQQLKRAQEELQNPAAKTAEVIDSIKEKTKEATEATASARIELAKLPSGLDVAGNAFKSLEDQLVSFVTTGKFEIKDFVNTILSDLARLATRQAIIQPLVNAFGGQLGGGIDALFNAKGNAFTSQGVQAFASGGVVNSPTIFPFANGGGPMRTGIMGESGSEAILPLSRSANGNLGVEASGIGGGGTVVNIVNKTDSDAQVSERTSPSGDRVIDVLIATSVNKGIQNGSFDRSMTNSFGLSRKGRV